MLVVGRVWLDWAKRAILPIIEWNRFIFSEYYLSIENQMEALSFQTEKRRSWSAFIQPRYTTRRVSPSGCAEPTVSKSDDDHVHPQPQHRLIRRPFNLQPPTFLSFHTSSISSTLSQSSVSLSHQATTSTALQKLIFSSKTFRSPDRVPKCLKAMTGTQ